MVSALVSLARLPDRVAIHFGLGGAPAGWASSLASALIMLFVGLLTLRANLSHPVRLDENLFLSGLWIFLAYTVYWTVVLLRAFREPKTP
jgi:hypothetical protein